MLRKAKQSARIDARPDKNLIMSLQKIATSEAFQDFHLKVGLHPIYLQYWSKMKIDIYNRLVKSENLLIISLDATGSIITPVPNNKRIYLYQIVAQSTKSRAQLQISQMISSEHNTGAISCWLLHWRYTGAMTPKIVVVDCSMAI